MVQNNDTRSVKGGCKQPSQKLKLRDSQMELLRIVAMSMILVYHFVLHGSIKSPEIGDYGPRISFIYYGVNLFVMISGYYGVKMRWQSFFSLLITVAYFGIISVIVKWTASCYLHGFHISYMFMLRDAVLNPFSGYWFISCYMVLFMFAPIINLGLKHASLVQLRTIVAVISCYCIYGGIIFDYAITAGYTVTQFFLLYIVGYWIRIDNPFHKVPVVWLCFIAVICSLINSTSVFKYILGDTSGANYTLSYINLFYFIGSIAIFIAFTRFKLRSRIINSIAGASLGCYLLQDGWIGKDVYIFQQNFFQNHPFGESVVMYTASFVAIWLASWALMWFKNLWAPKLIDAICRALPERWKQAVW